MGTVAVVCLGCRRVGDFPLEAVAAWTDEDVCSGCGSNDLDVFDAKTAAEDTLPSTTRLQSVDPHTLKPGDRVFVGAPGTVMMGDTPLYGVEQQGYIWTIEAVEGDSITATSNEGTKTFAIPPGRTLRKIVSKTASDFGGLSTDTPMGRVDPEGGEAVAQHFRCSSCLHEFDKAVPDPAAPMPNCPNCGSVATAVYPDSTKSLPIADWAVGSLDAAFAKLTAGAGTRVGGVVVNDWSEAERARLLDGMADFDALASAPAFPMVVGEDGSVDWAPGARERFAAWIAEVRGPSIDPREAKVSEVAAGILHTNPGMGHEAAQALAEETVRRFPRMVAGAVTSA